MDNEKFLVECGLYDKAEIGYDDFEDLIELLSGMQKIDLFCGKCKEKRIFSAKRNKIKVPKKDAPIRNIFSDYGNSEDDKQIHRAIMEQESQKELERFEQFLRENAVCILDYECCKDSNHYLKYILFIEDHTIQKIGQYPSYADIDIPQANVYRKELGNKYYGELKKAIGLYSCNVGIGSFVYLRRILEKLIMDAFEDAKRDGKISQEMFDYRIEGEKKYQRKVEEKIKLLSDYLPNILTENKGIYGVVSKGIHELEEDECKRYFPVVEQIIKMCLDDVIESKRRKQQTEELKKQLLKISKEIKEK